MSTLNSLAQMAYTPTEDTGQMKRKVCSCCKESKVELAFSLHSDSADGLDTQCRSCRNVKRYHWQHTRFKSARDLHKYQVGNKPLGDRMIGTVRALLSYIEQRGG